MRFALLPLYLIERKHRMAAAGGPLPLTPEAVDVACPRCGATYIGECLPEEMLHDVESCRDQSFGLLAAECPRHRSIFVVGILQSA